MRVLEGKPWVFEGNLFSVAKFDGGTPPSYLIFEKTAFWVRMYNLPLVCMGKQAGFQIEASIGMVEEVDADEEGMGWGEFLQVRIQLDLTKPLPRGHVLKYKGKASWVVFKYERLSRFCFQCKTIKYGPLGCLQRPEKGRKVNKKNMDLHCMCHRHRNSRKVELSIGHHHCTTQMVEAT